MRIEELVAEAFGLTVAEVDDATSADSVEAWDSLAHVNLVMHIEETYAVSLSTDETLEIRSVGEIRRVLGQHGVHV